MSETYRFILNGTKLDDEPEGWDKIIDTITRTDQMNTLFVNFDLTLVFNGGTSGYNLLYGMFYTSFCATATLDIYEINCGNTGYDKIISGIIFVSDCQFTDGPAGCFCGVKVRDNSFYAKINNNKSIKTFVEVGFSKNGVAFTGALDYQINCFDPCIAAGIWIGAYDRHTVTINEAFRSLVAFMTDDSIDYDSSFFKPGGDGEAFCITDGLHLSSTVLADYSAATNIEKICFADLYNECSKCFNLGIGIDYSGTRPKLVIELLSYFKNSTSVITLNNIDRIVTSIDTDSLYSQLHFGGKTAIQSGCPSPGLAFPQETTFITYNDETFFVLGVCNIDQTLDLYKNWIVDNNIIQDCVINGSTDYDKDIFIIETTYNYPGVSLAVQGDPFFLPTPDPRYYNPSLMNNAIADRFIGSVPNSIAQSLNNINDEFLAYKAPFDLLIYPAVTTIAPVSPFTNDSTPPYFDTGGNFTLATGRFTVPALAGGLYGFYARMEFRINILASSNTPSGAVTIQLKQNYWGPGPLFTKTGNETITIPTTELSFVVEIYSGLVPMNPADWVDLEITAALGGNLQIARLYVDNIEFGTTYTSNGGGFTHVYNPEDYPAYKHEFSYPMTRSEFQLLKNNPHYAIEINRDGINNQKVYIKEVKYSRLTGMADFTCISSKTLQS